MLNRTFSRIVSKSASTARRSAASCLRAAVASSSQSRQFSSLDGKKSGIAHHRIVSNPPEETPLTETIRDFLNPGEFYNTLGEYGFDFYTGVPDSLLKDFCAYVTDNAPASNHVITANEGSAVAVASGYHLATRKYPVVYMQNSGFGNAVNPLLSLTDPKVYSIPMLMLVGWRGEPGKKDEPQHIVQGKVMSSLLADMGLQFEVLPDYIEGARESIETALHYMQRRNAPYVFLVRRQTFTKYGMKSVQPNIYNLSREQAISKVASMMTNWDILVATTGFASRELYEFRERVGQDHRREFLTVGSMGHASAIALGISMFKQSRQVYCLDGDGAVFMHMGNLSTIAHNAPKNFKHIVFNNGAHDSVGGQPTEGFKVDFQGIFKNCGYKTVLRAATEQEIETCFRELQTCEGPALLEIMVNKGARKDLGRPLTTPLENKQEFMQFLLN